MESVKSNTEKEVREETVLEACAARLIAVQDRNKHNVSVYAYDVCKILFFALLQAANLRKILKPTKSAGFPFPICRKI